MPVRWRIAEPKLFVVVLINAVTQTYTICSFVRGCTAGCAAGCCRADGSEAMALNWFLEWLLPL